MFRAPRMFCRRCSDVKLSHCLIWLLLVRQNLENSFYYFSVGQVDLFWPCTYHLNGTRVTRVCGNTTPCFWNSSQSLIWSKSSPRNVELARETSLVCSSECLCKVNKNVTFSLTQHEPFPFIAWKLMFSASHFPEFNCHAVCGFLY